MIAEVLKMRHSIPQSEKKLLKAQKRGYSVESSMVVQKENNICTISALKGLQQLSSAVIGKIMEV